ncbi:MAG: class I SAM-dependent methyltransferase, partial [Anaerolineales bacterium]
AIFREVPPPDWAAWAASRAVAPADLATTLAILGALPRAARRVLALGCGTGRNLVPLMTYGAQVVGLDASPAAARASAARPGHPVVMCADAARAPCPSAAYDFVLALGLLPHLPPDDIPRTLAEAARVLRPGGLALLHFWDVQDARAAVGVPWRGDAARGTLSFADEDQIGAWLAGAGLNAVDWRRRRVVAAHGPQVDWLVTCQKRAVGVE